MVPNLKFNKKSEFLRYIRFFGSHGVFYRADDDADDALLCGLDADSTACCCSSTVP